MRSPWGESNYRNEGGDDRSNGYDRGGGGGGAGGSISHGLLGSLIERSTSAPPMSTESGLSFGDGNTGSLFGREQRAVEREQSTMAPLYENNRNNRDDRGGAGPEGTFLARPQAGRASGSPSYSKPDFTSLLPDGLGPESASSSSKVLDDKGLDFSEAGAAIIRSQSAAPTFHGRSPLFPPPGLAEIKESQPTPSTVDSYSTQPSTVDSYSSSHSNSTANFESAIDRGADIMKVGQRRSHSTSAIGNGGLYSSPRDGGGGGGLRSNTLMSMGILEEDPPENGHGGPTRVPIQQDNYDNYHHRPDNNRHQQTHQTHSPVPPHMQQPQRHQQRPGLGGGGEPQYVYAQQPQQHPQQLAPPPHQQQHHQPQQIHLQHQPHHQQHQQHHQHQHQQHPPPPHQPHHQQHQPQVHLQQPQYVTHRGDPHNPHEPPRNVMQQQPPLRDPYEVQAPMGAPMAAAPMGQMQGDPMRAAQPQYVTLADHGIPGEPPRAQSSIYAPAVPHGGHPVHRAAPPPPPPQAAEAQRQIYYGGQPQQVDVQTPVLTQSGQTVYLNAPAAPYGYATVQYHPHQQPQIIRQTVPGRGHPHEQFVSVVPIQGGPAQLASIAGSGQTYAYWQPDGGGAPLAVPQVTIMNAAGPGGAPIAVARIGNPAMESQHSNNGYRESGRGGKEKGRKGRRDGGTPSRRGGDTKHSSHSMSSPLLDEFRATKSRDWTIRDIEGHVVEFCQDQNGSRFIQQRLEIGDNTEQKLVMNEVLPAIHRLRNDVFGNYVVQKLLEFGTNQMKSDIRDTLQGEMLQLSLQMYGCRVVQKALETLDEDDLPRLLKEFHHNVLSCIHDQNGNHVIQKCIEVMSNRAKKARENGDDAKADFLSEQIDFVVDDVLGNTASLSCHPYGCRVLQRILEHCIESKKTAALDEISKCHKTLLDDQYGNYVIQHVLQFGRQEDRESILHIVVENGLLSLSKQKFASNVVEKLLKYGTAEQRKAVVREMLKVVDDQTGEVGPAGGSSGSSVVLLMVRDAYANYVVQTTLDVVPECEERKLLLDELNAHAAELRNYTFAKHIMQKLSA